MYENFETRVTYSALSLTILLIRTTFVNARIFTELLAARLRPVLSRYLEADLAADLGADLRTKTDRIGLKSDFIVGLDRMVPILSRLQNRFENQVKARLSNILQ